MSDLIGTVLGLVLTLFVFSYVIGENFLYRLAIYIFAGLTAGFVGVIIYDSVLYPWVQNTLLTGDPRAMIYGAIPIVLAALLLLPRRLTGVFRKIALAIIISVGAAVSLVGAVRGTLLPYIFDIGDTVAINPIVGSLTAVGVVTTLVYFQFMARERRNGPIRRNWITEFLSTIGSFFIAVTMGVIYASAIISSMTIFSDRIVFLIDGFTRLFNGG
jgi:hypothetical protein